MKKNECLSWDDTVEYCQILGVEMVPVIYDGIYDEKVIKDLYSSEKYDIQEGYVVRLADSFHFKDFEKAVGKFVRKNHVQTTAHWMFGHNKTHETNDLKNGVSFSTLIK